MISVIVNLVAAVCYFGRTIADFTCTHGFAPFTDVKYGEYLVTAPLLVLDLLWHIEAPYKCTCAVFTLVTIFTGVASITSHGLEAYLWFLYGNVVFIITYLNIFRLVRR
eukprot:CAMPEP_0113725490 /NCGR_PEP_ID=MMETSP0038_2-20120614/39781_1 /TAXON_ID=2898 /ORGANISM="Cryptomonas paramecium" /LENGTH=108 /DNA_ID=CAMNT_0000655743 /DNA_START=97 /DNA_END=419 /DNA_ORIENTATION=- /assembly_acc=CAM_ASM_000170